MESIPFPPSRNIQSISYDLDTQTLLIRYHHQDRTYKYSGVTGEDVAGFSAAISANDYLQEFILSRYRGERINAEDLEESSDENTGENAG